MTTGLRLRPDNPTDPWGPRWPRLSVARMAVAIIVATAVPLLAAACSRTPTQSGAIRGGSAYAQALSYADCMRTHGVPKWPDPNSYGGFAKSQLTLQALGVTSSQFHVAETACQHLVPKNGLGGAPTSADVQQVRAQSLRFSQCMRTHGIAGFPDPDSNGGIQIPDSVERTPGYAAALNACKPFPPAP